MQNFSFFNYLKAKTPSGGGGLIRVIIISLFATLACVGIIKAATTIGTNISTGGTITGSGANTLYGATSIGGALTATSTLSVTGLSIFDSNVGIGTSSPYAKLSVVGEIVGSYFTATSTTATSTFANGIYLTSGCFRGANGSCVGSSINGMSGGDVSGEINVTVSESVSNNGGINLVVGTPDPDDFIIGEQSHHSGVVVMSENTEGNSLISVNAISVRDGLAFTAPTCPTASDCAENNTIIAPHSFAYSEKVYLTTNEYDNVVAYTSYPVCEIVLGVSFKLDGAASPCVGADCSTCVTEVDIADDTSVTGTFYRASNSGYNAGGQFGFYNYHGQQERFAAGVRGEAYQNEAGAVVSQMAGVFGKVLSNAAGTLTQANALQAGSCTANAGTITNCSGLYVGAQTGGTNNYDIFLDGDVDSAIDSSVSYVLGAMQIPALQAIYSQLSTTEDLVIGWLSPDPSSGTEFDFSGGTNAFSYANMSATADDNTMWGGRYLTFDDIDDELTRADDSDFELLSNDWTITGWIKPTASNIGTIIAKQGEWTVYHDASSRIIFDAVDSSDADVCARRTSSATALAGTWYYFAIVHSGNGGTDYCSAELTFYLNGLAVSTASGGDSITGGFTITGGAGTLSIGNGSGGTGYYNGSMGPLVVDNGKALNATEVLYLYNSTRALYGK
jgi:hypothetical protein